MQDFTINAETESRLKKYIDRVGDVLGNKKRRASLAVYAQGLLGDGDRKSVEPIAARACPDPDRVDAVHQQLLNFLAVSPWSDHDVRRTAARYAVGAMVEREAIETWIIDDTGFLKQGSHSVGVQRQYTGSAGKVTNCQIGVSLSLATATAHVPVDFELYLPKCWANDPDRRGEGRIPDEVVFKTKPQLAVDVLQRAIDADLPRGVVLADVDYGRDSDFRQQVSGLGLRYAVAVRGTTKVHVFDRSGTLDTEAISIEDLALLLAYQPRAYRRYTWREGTKETLSARFAFGRVVAARGDSAPLDQREVLWLVCEWPDGELLPAKYYLANMPKKVVKKRLVRLIKERWRTERLYQDLKGHLGIDHYEGRRFPGWHHHVSVVLCCYAFIIAERVRRFSPSATGTPQHHALHRAA
jgi:SRSO17 transposase